MKKFLVFLVLLSVVSCGKKNDRLARNYHKLAMLELTESAVSDQSYKKALHYLELACEQDPKVDYLALKATLLFKLGHEHESCVAFEHALTLVTDQRVKSEILNNYACVLAQMARVDQAEAIWQELERSKDYLTPEVALVNRGKLAISGNKLELAKEHFMQALALAPHYLDAHYYVALTADALHDQALVKQSIKTVLFLEPEHRGAQELARKIGIYS